MRMRIATPLFLATAYGLLTTASVQAAQWTMATPYGDASFHTQNTKQFAEDVAEMTDGELTITVHSGGSLVSHGEIKPSVRRGTIDAGEVFMSVLSNDDPIFEIDTLPGVAGSYEDAFALWQATKPMITELFAQEGLIPLYAVAWPAQGIYTAQELTDPAQFEGLRVRAPNINTQRFVNNLGGSPTETEESDIPTAFSTGRVDAMITSSSTGNSMTAWDYVSYYTDANLWLPKNIVFISQRSFDRLDEETQESLMEAAARAEERGWQLSRENNEESLATLEENGVSVAKPNEEVAAALQAAGDQLFQDWLSRADDEAEAALEAYREQQAN
ncbi:TRAP transporter substrate-binding protein [Vreelandella populi]|uniref:C4-dicarboxylate ABC transporter substrate-binding protein n=1 Tax=Vreelandella populi TaxID=2498858 RepID=A0A3S0ZFC3_9GAMM|nr:TRAP transporter substrate-binding protein [Halomonas populi]RUR35424.1 C4-dicarboxylate ABC transporter substrate-binding protein [Halomonas populi]RUR47614.1 C4-dicarboxylate ABC transporter substrate-binding protein [Halomonas populi]